MYYYNNDNYNDNDKTITITMMGKGLLDEYMYMYTILDKASTDEYNNGLGTPQVRCDFGILVVILRLHLNSGPTLET